MYKKFEKFFPTDVTHVGTFGETIVIDSKSDDGNSGDNDVEVVE